MLGFSPWWLPLLWSTASRARAQLPQGMWDLPGPGTEPMSPELAGGFSTTGPPGKSKSTNLDPILFYFLETYSISITSNSLEMQSPRPPPHSNEMPRWLPCTLKFESKALTFFFFLLHLEKARSNRNQEKGKATQSWDLPSVTNGKEPPTNTGDIRGIGSIPGFKPWRMAWQPTPVFLPGESNGQRNLVGYSP